MRKKGTLYTVNKWNQPLFGSKKNLFVAGGNTAYNPNMYGVLSNNYSNSNSNNYFGTQTPLQQPTFRYQYGYRSNSPEINHLSYNLDYNKGFGYNSNVFGSNQSNNSLHLNTNLKLDNVASTSNAPQDSTTNIESSGQGVNWGGMGAGIASIILENEMTIGNKTFKRGAWDALDPVYYAANGRESEAGDTLSNLGVKVTKASLASGQWYGALAGAGLKIAGGIDNAVAGTKTDTDSLNAVNKDIYMGSNYYSGASSFDDLQTPITFYDNTDVYEGPSKSAENWAGGIGTVAGMLTGIPGLGTLFGRAYKKRSQKAREEAEKKNRELKEKQEFANQWATNSYINNINNIKQDQYNRALANFSAYGGPLEQMAMNNQGMAAIDYGFMTDYLAAKNQQNQQKTNMTNMFAGTAPTMFAEGGGIHIKPSHKGLFTAKAKRAGMGVQAFARHVLANKEDYPASTRKQAAFAKAASSWKHAEGGPLVNMATMETPMPVIDSALYANGGQLASQSDFTDGLVQVNAGGTHEMNPNDGVQMGVDNQMNPNLVEEGETVFDDYVYSNRIFVDDDTKKRYGINKKKKITYAELSKKLEKEASERQNDPISQAGLKASMADLADAQEAEKMKIEAERAKAAFDSLTPEEQTALMQRAAQEEQVAQVAAQQEVLARQQAIQEQQNIEACGGKINKFEDGGIKPYAYSRNWDGFDYYDPITQTYNEGYLNFANNVNQDWVNRILSGQYGSMDRYLAANNGLAITPSQVAALATDKKYSDMHKAMASAYKEYLAGINPITGEPKIEIPVSSVVHHAWDGDEEYWTPEMESRLSEGTPVLREVVLPNGEKVIYHQLQQGDVSTPTKSVIIDGNKEEADNKPEDKKDDGSKTEEELESVEPRHRAEWPRYVGLFGPAVGLGMMAAGVGKPDYSNLDAALEIASSGPKLASYQTLGDYLTYRPMDIWAEQNRLDANTRAADRAIMSGNNPARYAALLANNYNAQLASGDLYRKALEYNDAKRAQVAEFNRGTNQYNADAYTRNSQFNADAINRANQYKAGLAAQIASQKLGYDNDWYGSMYANMGNLFQGLSDLGRENVSWNMVSKTAADTTNLGDSYTGDIYLKKGKKRSKGGKLNKNDLKL